MQQVLSPEALMSLFRSFLEVEVGHVSVFPSCGGPTIVRRASFLDAAGNVHAQHGAVLPSESNARQIMGFTFTLYTSMVEKTARPNQIYT